MNVVLWTYCIDAIDAVLISAVTICQVLFSIDK